MIFLKIILLFAMLCIAYEDFRFRAISLYSLFIFFVTAVVYSLILQGFKPTIYSMSWNLLIISFELIITWLYFAVIKRQGKGFVNKKIGLGDLLFYIPVLFLFSPLNFICIHIISLVIILATYAFFTNVLRSLKTIPLAGGHSVILILALSLSWNYNPVILYDDMLIADFLYSLRL